MIRYLQKRNSNVLGIADKLFAPQERKLDKMKKILEKESSESLAAGCSLAKRCGGCVYQGISYKDQLKIKQKEVGKCLKEERVLRGQANHWYGKSVSLLQQSLPSSVTFERC